MLILIFGQLKTLTLLVDQSQINFKHHQLFQTSDMSQGETRDQLFDKLEDWQHEPRVIATLPQLKNLIHKHITLLGKIEDMSDPIIIIQDAIGQVFFNFDFESLESALTHDYTAWIDRSVGPFLELSEKIGGDVAKMAQLWQTAINAQKQFLTVASRHSKPSDSDLQKCLEPQVKAITAVTSFRESNRRSDFFNHLSAVSEAIPALSWILISPTPGPHVKEMKDASMFYTNRVLKDYKGKDENHVEWTKKLMESLDELVNYIKQHHTTGLVWNVKVIVIVFVKAGCKI
jgi:hypothetical protein